MVYKIGSFNVRNLAIGSQRDLDRIARLIRTCHICALQEVLGENALVGAINKNKTGRLKAYENSLLRRLGPRWRVAWCPSIVHAKNYPYKGKDNRGEGYAFLWRTDIFELLHDEYGKEIEPRVFSNYKTIENGMMRLIRDPACGRFRSVTRKEVEIRLVTTHIVYGKPKPENVDIDLDDIGAITMRRNEFKILAGQIYPRVSEYYKDINCTSPYTVILGDYNLNLRSSGVGKAIVPDVMCFDKKGFSISSDDERLHCKIITVQNSLSTLKRDEPGLASNYDHFSFDERVSRTVRGCRTMDAINTGAKTINEEERYKEYKDKVSDHLPIILELSL